MTFEGVPKAELFDEDKAQMVVAVATDVFVPVQNRFSLGGEALLSNLLLLLFLVYLGIGLGMALLRLVG